MLRNLRAGFFILALVMSAGVALTDEVPLPDTSQFSIARFTWTAVTVAILTSYIFFKSGITPPGKTALGSPHFVPPSEQEVAESQLAVGNYNRGTTELFFDMLGDLPKYLVRIREDVQVLGDTSQLRVTRHVTG